MYPEMFRHFRVFYKPFPVRSAALNILCSGFFYDSGQIEEVKRMDQMEKWMRRALELGERGRGYTSPNPMVGAVLIRDGKILGEDWHRKAGEHHAERLLLERMEAGLEEATLVVNLEPCCHFGRTPPCTDIILEKRVGRVVIGALDPDPRVSGEGIRILKEAGVRVETGVLEKECRRLNRVFYHYKETGRPLVTMKYAMTADGKIATSKGESRWITGPEAREQVHRSRHENSGILVGIGTVLADDPMLDCRIPGGRSGVRIVCDSHLRIPENSRLALSAREVPLVVATASDDPQLEVKKAQLEKMGVRIMTVPGSDGQVDLKMLTGELAAMGIDSILMEGGGTLNEAALKQGIVDRLQVYMAPKIFGGESARSPVEGRGVSRLEDAYGLRLEKLEVVGEDVFVEYQVVRRDDGCLPESWKK